MAKKTKRPKAKHPISSKAKASARSVPLVAENSAARRSEPVRRKRSRVPAFSNPLYPMTAMFEFMQRVTSAYAELPARVAQCRSLMDVWAEQMRFGQRILSVTQASGSASADPRSKRVRKASS
jgi:hypothetical protein